MTKSKSNPSVVFLKLAVLGKGEVMIHVTRAEFVELVKLGEQQAPHAGLHRELVQTLIDELPGVLKQDEKHREAFALSLLGPLLTWPHCSKAVTSQLRRAVRSRWPRIYMMWWIKEAKEGLNHQDVFRVHSYFEPEAEFVQMLGLSSP
jgi:hypothetical protein